MTILLIFILLFSFELSSGNLFPLIEPQSVNNPEHEQSAPQSPHKIALNGTDLMRKPLAELDSPKNEKTIKDQKETNKINQAVVPQEHKDIKEEGKEKVASHEIKLNKDVSNPPQKQNEGDKGKEKNKDFPINNVQNNLQEESGYLTSFMMILLVISIVFIVFVGYKTYRRKSRNARIKKYGVRLTRGNIEMTPLPLDNDDDDETVFDLQNVPI